ncbi:pilus assembly protein N-terminal domain-containing protein [Pyxidicoccus parkwayensis]|uniref:Pilus assembly protein N-terminal domain-containing protein n=1 Tax=Pyxidicoccus parkwayensis TaxID=2813578 RepID=A0ABX7NYZ2_9BACT|nr:pilus assembly protein N-terminal domain-containing protein [Pyxidicoccus parkwaysis]QSQ24132.1 pilus assembly protein N-terminal domain-containing protein [Pyxidicoccus parkwaysis]
MHHGMKLALVALTLIGTPVLAAEETKPAKAAEAAPAPEGTVTLKKGGQKDLSVPGMVRVAIDDPEVADVDLANKGVLRLTGSKAGETTLLVWVGPENKRGSFRIIVHD